ncbi:hypothetical protein [Tenacibaculum sp. 190524A05c]|uniref:hypothetical protein n=1 Tax=Tenacibaculum platacis TaxID=3137852 RepID=UPI0031FBA2CA
MKKTILNLGTKLSKEVLKEITGGVIQSSGRCAYYNGETGKVNYNISSSHAQNSLHNSSDHWCCDSCNSASWFDADDAMNDFWEDYR